MSFAVTMNSEIGISELYASGRYLKILDVYRQQPDADRTPSELILIGRCLVRSSDDRDEASSYWHRLAERTDVDQYLVNVMLERLALQADDVVSAEHFLERAEAVDHNRVDARHHLIEHMLRIGDNDKAAQLIDSAPPAQLPALWRSRSVLAFRRRDLALNVEVLKERIRMAPEDHGARVMLARTFFFSRDFARARMVLPAKSLAKDETCLLREVEARLVRDEDPAGALELLRELKIEPGSSSERVAKKLDKHAHVLRANMDSESIDYTDFSITQIFGVSFCGSTILSICLSQDDDIMNVGESHRIIRSKNEDKNGFRNELFNFQNSKSGVNEPEYCLECGYPCRLFDDKFREELQLESVDYLYKLLIKSRCAHLIASDKTRIIEVDPLFRCNAIVLFKSPVNSIRSHMKRKKVNSEKGVFNLSDMQYWDLWYQYYMDCMKNYRIKGRKIFLSFEKFLANPEGILKRIGELLSLPIHYQNERMSISGQHMFGGNREMIARGHFDVQPNPNPLTDEDAESRVPPHVRVLHSQLIARHRACFE